METKSKYFVVKQKAVPEVLLKVVEAKKLLESERVITVQEATEAVGISRQHLASIEAPRMNRGLSLELLFNIATVLEVEPYLLLKFRLQK